MTNTTTGLARVGVLQRYIKACCDRSGVQAVFKRDIPTAYTTRDSIVIPEITSNLSEDDETLLRFQVCHELDGHQNSGPEVFDIMEEYNLRTDTPLGALFNIVEDQRIEKCAAERYDGNARVISNGRELVGRRSLAKIREIAGTVTKDGMHPDTARMQGAFLTAMIAGSAWCPGTRTHLMDEIEETVEHFPSVHDHMTTLAQANIASDINNLSDCAQSFELAKKMYGLLWDKTPEDVEKEVKEQQEKAAKEKENSEGEETEEAAGTPKVGKGKKDGAPCEGIDPRTGKYRLPFDYFVKSSHDDKGTRPKSGHGLGLDYTGYDGAKTFIPFHPSEFKVNDHRKNIGSLSTGTLRNFSLLNYGGDSVNLGIETASTTFATKVRRYLQVRSAVRYEGGKERGRLHSRTLYRAALPCVGDGTWNRKVFRTREQEDLLDCAVTLLGDVSGSMSGPKVVHMTNACMLLNHVISNMLRVSTEILTFTFDERPMIDIIKAHDERVSDDTVLRRMDHAANEMYGNDDADALLWAYDRLVRRREKRKVLIVLSDGSPADGKGDTDPYYALRETVSMIRKSGIASVLGIGIMDTSVSSFYPEHIIIRKASELEDKLLGVVNKKIRNG